MQDYIPREVDINDTIEAITVKQFDNNSRQIHIKFRDVDLTDVDDNSLDLSNCTTTMYIRPANYVPGLPGHKVSFIEGTVESAENGTVTFLLPGGVTNRAGTYECEIWLYGGDTTLHPIISSNPFTLVVKGSIKNDSALEATEDMSALNARIVDIRTLKTRVNTLEQATGSIFQYRSGINDQYSDYHSHVYEYTNDGTFFTDKTHWSDLPTDDSDYIITNARYNDNWILQTAVKVTSPGVMYNRLVQMTGGTGNYPWHIVGGS